MDLNKLPTPVPRTAKPFQTQCSDTNENRVNVSKSPVPLPRRRLQGIPGSSGVDEDHLEGNQRSEILNNKIYEGKHNPESKEIFTAKYLEVFSQLKRLISNNDDNPEQIRGTILKKTQQLTSAKNDNNNSRSKIEYLDKSISDTKDLSDESNCNHSEIKVAEKNINFFATLNQQQTCSHDKGCNKNKDTYSRDNAQEDEVVYRENDCKNMHTIELSNTNKSTQSSFRKSERYYINYTINNHPEEEVTDSTVPGHKTREKNIIKEIITTETTYVYNLQRVVQDYQSYLCNYVPEEFKENVQNIFGNISDIYRQAQQFLVSLQENEDGLHGIIHLFVNSAEQFNLYIEYSKTRLDADVYLQEIHDIIKEREKELNDYTGLVTHLSSPLRRLSKYVLMLENIRKELKVSKISVDDVEFAKSIIENVLKKCNDLIAINSIKHCELDLTKQGSFIMRAPFNILFPRRFPSMVFLFENIVVFTERTKYENEFRYVDSIKMTHLNIRNSEDKSLTFFLTDFHRLKKFNDNFASYLLETEKEKVKKEWVNTIETKLWEQLHKAKENRKYSKDLPFEDTSISPTGTLKRQNKSTSSAVFYIDDTDDSVGFV